MSKILISHNTALWIYRNMRTKLYGLPEHYQNISDTQNIKLDLKDLKLLKTDLEYYGKLDVIICNYKNRTRNQYTQLHAFTKTFPKNSFVKMQSYNVEYFLSSPEFLFCQMAEQLPAVKLFLFGLELCGTYSIDNNTQETIYHVPRLSSPKKIRAFAKNLKLNHKYFHSIGKAIYIANLLEENSASPQESRLYIRLAAPKSIGGYGIKNLKLNAKIDLSENASLIAGQDCLRVDLSIASKKIAIEYDSEEFHDNSSQNIRDKSRLDALNYDGWKTFSIVGPQMKSTTSFDTIAKKILILNHQEARIKTKNFDILNRQLANILS